MIRLLGHDDLDRLLELYTHLFTKDEPLPARSTVLQVWEQILTSGLVEVFGLFQGEELVSSCTLTITPNLTRGARPWGQVENVVTHAAHRRRGLGKILIRHTLARAWSKDCYKVMLLTGRPEVHSFYEQCGFRKGEKTGFVAHRA